MVETTNFKVVVNHEGQYSVVPADQKLSGAWQEVEKSGTQKQCLKYIEEVWTDMTPSDYKNILNRLNIQR